jgi:dihydrolipoamide dehydrogenase
MENKQTNVAVVGGGPGGYVAAIRAAQLGKKVLLVEKSFLGGTCLNIGCIPSKALISAAGQVAKMQQAAKMGITVSGVSVDMKKTQEWKSGVVQKLTSGVGQLCKGNGVEVLMGEARFTGPRTLLVKAKSGEVEVQAENIILATGSVPTQIPGFPTDEQRVLTSTGALALTEIPKRLIVIGGGYIGLELGMLYAKLGSAVTVVEMMDQLLPGFEPELVRIIAAKVRKLGMSVYLKSKASNLEVLSAGIRIQVETQGKQESLEADYLLVTVGRRPNTAGLDLDKAGVRCNEAGFIPVDKRLKTAVEGIYAIGDVVGNPMLAHKASKEGEVAAEVIAGKAVELDYQAIPAVVFTDPEIATVGLSEAQAASAGYEVLTGKFPLAASGRALSMGETDGYIKVVADKKSHALLGTSIIGAEASELIAEATLAIEMGAVVEDIGMTIHAHPSLAESFMEAAKATIGEAIHVLQK